MKKIIIITALLVLMLTGFCHAKFYEWNKVNKMLFCTGTTLSWFDIAQTRHWGEYTKANPRHINEYKIYEINPIVAGKDYEEIVLISTVGQLALYKIADEYMTDNQRTLVYLTLSMVEGYIVMKNSKDIEHIGFENKVSFIGLNF